jgi:hypothetical protein
MLVDQPFVSDEGFLRELYGWRDPYSRSLHAVVLNCGLHRCRSMTLIVERPPTVGVPADKSDRHFYEGAVMLA